MPEYDYKNVNMLWDEDTDKKNCKHELNVVRKLNQKESENALNFWHCTEHFKHRVYRLESNGIGIGMVAGGFLVDKGHDKGMEEHYVTSTGLVIIRNHDSGKAITILVARPEQVERYFSQLGFCIPSKIVRMAERNRKLKLNY